MRIKINDRPSAVEREVSGDFGSFKIRIRTPVLEERFQLRSYQLRHLYDELGSFVLRFLVGWSGIDDENGVPVPFNERTKRIVLDGNEDIATAIGTVIAKFFDENTVQALTEDEVKNSEAPPENGSTVAPTTETLPTLTT